MAFSMPICRDRCSTLIASMLAMAMTTEASTNVWMMMLEKPWLSSPLSSWAFCCLPVGDLDRLSENMLPHLLRHRIRWNTSLTCISMAVMASPKPKMSWASGSGGQDPVLVDDANVEIEEAGDHQGQVLPGRGGHLDAIADLCGQGLRKLPADEDLARESGPRSLVDGACKIIDVMAFWNWSPRTSTDIVRELSRRNEGESADTEMALSAEILSKEVTIGCQSSNDRDVLIGGDGHLGELPTAASTRLLCRLVTRDPTNTCTDTPTAMPSTMRMVCTLLERRNRSAMPKETMLSSSSGPRCPRKYGRIGRPDLLPGIGVAFEGARPRR